MRTSTNKHDAVSFLELTDRDFGHDEQPNNQKIECITFDVGVNDKFET